jgi:hypothetical protein
MKERQRLDVSFSFFKEENDYIFVYFLGLNHLVGLDIAQNGVHISSSKPAGEAFVAFTNMDNALRALEFNRMNMGHRYGKQSAKILPFHNGLSQLKKKLPFFLLSNQIHLICPSSILKIYSEFEPPPPKNR